MSTNILRDVTATIQLMGADDGTAGGSVGSSVTLCLDKVSYSQSRETFDASCEQSLDPLHRVKKNNWEVKIDTKLESGFAFWESLQASTAVVVTFVLTDVSGTTISSTGLISTIDVEIGYPSTMQLVIIPYGLPLTITLD